MYSITKHLGKYEGNESQLTAEVLHRASLDGTIDEYGECDGPYGWNGLILGKRYGFLIHEDNYGFFSYEVHSREEAKARFDKFVKEAEAALME